MARHLIIRRFLAGLLLLLFTFGTTPKKILHDLFAHHKDMSARTGGNIRTAQLINSGFSCNCESQVVESPFTEALTPLELILPSFTWPEKFSRIDTISHWALVPYSALRGPPTV
ncbi:MAG TPA: hypothetical protein VE035_04090 [Puia sp.]|nr:hypothetical protein [Puia sp.]